MRIWATAFGAYEKKSKGSVLHLVPHLRRRCVWSWRRPYHTFCESSVTFFSSVQYKYVILMYSAGAQYCINIASGEHVDIHSAVSKS